MLHTVFAHQVQFELLMLLDECKTDCSVISIFANVAFSQRERSIIYVDEEQKWTRSRVLRDTTVG